MSTASVIVAIVVLLGVLTSFAFVQQTVKNKREQKQRLVAALKSRLRNFKFMLSGFPEGFLTKELTALVHRSVMDVAEQLSKLEPNEPQHLQDLQLAQQHLSEAQRHAKPTSMRPLDNHQQIKEVKACLEELHKFVFKLEERNVVPRNQGQAYRQQIRQLVLQVSIDSYCLNGTQAKQNGKTKLAIHYFDLALNLIKREAKSDVFRTRVDKLTEVLAELKEQLAAEGGPALSAQEQAEQDETKEEWNKFSSDGEDLWKKKNIYD